jgi:hypothetical protein
VADSGSDDVASTLNDLERKLRALESDLQSAIAEPVAPPAVPRQPPVAPPPPDLSPPPDLAPPPDPAPPPVADAPVAPPSIYAPTPLTDGDPEEIVSEARRRITDLRAELDELARTREEIAKTANELVSDYNRVLNEPPAPPPAADPPAPPQVTAPPSAPTPQPLPPEHTIQQGPVAIDAGFFRDLTSLSAFEQSIARVPGVVGVHVRSFSQGRAVIDAQLSHPIPLGAELARHAPLRFTVTDSGPQHLMLAIAG